MANAGCINAYDCNGCLIQTLQNLDSACIGVGVQYTAPNPLDDKRLDYIKYTDKCGCVQCLSAENEILIYATNGVIKNLTLTNDDVNEAIKIKWNDIFGSNRAKTIVRYKTGSYPVSITDGTLAVEETTKNQYSSTPFSLSGVLDETTYYITAFAVDSNNVVIGTQQTTITTSFGWHPSANTLLYYNMNGNANDLSGNGYNGTATNVTWNAGGRGGCASFNGSNSKILIPSLSSSSIATVCFMMKSTQYTSQGEFFQFANEADKNSLEIYLSYGKLHIQSWEPQTDFSSDILINDGNWHNIIVVINGNSFKGYIDGVEKISYTFSKNIVLNYVNVIGLHSNGSSAPYNGFIDEVIIENTNWNQSKITKYYNWINKYYQ